MLLPVCNHDHTGTVVHNIQMYIIHIVHQLLKQHFMRGCGIGQGLYTLGISTGREAWAWFKANGGAHGVLFWGTSLLGGGRGGASARTW